MIIVCRQPCMNHFAKTTSRESCMMSIILLVSRRAWFLLREIVILNQPAFLTFDTSTRSGTEFLDSDRHTTQVGRSLRSWCLIVRFLPADALENNTVGDTIAIGRIGSNPSRKHLLVFVFGIAVVESSPIQQRGGCLFASVLRVRQLVSRKYYVHRSLTAINSWYQW